MITAQKKINHVLWRAGFGPSAEQLRSFQSADQAVDRLFSDAKKIQDINAVPAQFRSKQEMMGRSKEDKKMMKQESKEEARQVSVAWLELMFKDENALREKMSLFWHGHLACKCEAGYFAQQYVNVIRKNALGSFSDLLFGIAKSPAMMMFLDTMRNRKGSPNENFSRELMELFTLGKGNYTEDDIKNAARAFTGWGVIPPGQFIVRNDQHDNGTKTIFGKRGNFSGDDVIRIILDNKQTSIHVTTKIYKYFVNDQVNEERVNSLADSFYKSGYDIGKLMKTIFTSDWFYDEENIGVRIKSPIELITGLTRTFNVSFADPAALILTERTMGQQLLNPPNVAGWPGGKNWIDSSTLMYRLNFGNMMLAQSTYDLVPKGDVEDMTMMDGRARMGKLKPQADWSPYLGLYTDQPEEKIYATVSDYLVNAQLQSDQLTVESFTSNSSKEEYIRSLTLRILSMPEYQMC